MMVPCRAAALVVALSCVTFPSAAFAQTTQRRPAAPGSTALPQARKGSTSAASPVVVPDPGSTGADALQDDPWVDEVGDTMTGTLTLQPANDQAIDIASGSLYKAGTLFLHERGAASMALGADAMPDNLGGFLNTALGARSLFSNTFGISNTAVGYGTLADNWRGSDNTAVGTLALGKSGSYYTYSTEANCNTAVGSAALTTNEVGSYNTAVGARSLAFNTGGDANTAMGDNALWRNTRGERNTALGRSALVSNTTGSDNIAVGHLAGSQLDTGDDNIAIGNRGVAGDDGVIRIGTGGTHAKAFFAGIRGRTTGVADAITVLIDSQGQLGTLSSSRRLKEDVEDMGDRTARLLDLRPVVFRFKEDVRPAAGDEQPLEYGLIAEEAAEVFPELVVRDEEGRPRTVKYRLLSSMLLNEVQRQAGELDELRSELQALWTRVETR
jgi:hypothetical protein